MVEMNGRTALPVATSSAGSWMWAAMLVLGIGVAAACAATPLTAEAPRSAASPPAVAAGEQPPLSGRFHIIWNDRTRYFLADDQGRWTELLLDEEIVKPLGGPLVLNRRRVKIVGVPVASPPNAIRVLYIGLE